MRFRNVSGPAKPVRETDNIGYRIKFLMIRDGFNCHWCDRELDNDAMTIDHVIPSGNGGKNCLNNMVLACGTCNHYRGMIAYVEFCEMVGRLPSRRVVNRLKRTNPYCGHCHNNVVRFRARKKNKKKQTQRAIQNQRKSAQRARRRLAQDIVSIDYRIPYELMVHDVRVRTGVSLRERRKNGEIV